jgi:diguanylate cyclase (GGDEF)-like protein
MPDHAMPAATDRTPEDNPLLDRRFSVFSVLVLVSGVAAAVAVSWWLPFHGGTELIFTGLLLAAGFLVVEQLSVNIDVRGGVSWTISFTEIPLAIGLFVAPFQVVLAAHLIAGVGTLLVRRVQDRVLYNTGAEIFEIAVAYTVLTVVASAVGGSEPDWFAVFIAALSAPITSTLLALVAVYVLGRRMRLTAGLKLVFRTLVLGLVNASVGVVGYEVATGVDYGWPLVIAMLGGLWALYLAYSGLLREQRDLEALSEVSLIVARSGRRAAARPAAGPETSTAVGLEDWLGIAQRIKDQLGAARVVLRLRFDPGQPMHTVVAGDELAADMYDVEPTGARADALLRLPGSHVRHFRRVDALPEVRTALTQRNAQEALVVPLRSASHLLGVVEAHDKLSRWRGFGQADVRMIGTTASHLATALDNRRLLATLRHDAYHDPLTGLYNRPGFRQVATELLTTNPGSVMLRLDLEVQPAISDALGYAWSDRIVIAAGRRLRDTLGADTPLARLEGGAFAALLVDSDVEQAELIANQLITSLSASYPVDRLVISWFAISSAWSKSESTSSAANAPPSSLASGVSAPSVSRSRRPAAMTIRSLHA